MLKTLHFLLFILLSYNQMTSKLAEMSVVLVASHCHCCHSNKWPLPWTGNDKDRICGSANLYLYDEIRTEFDVQMQLLDRTLTSLCIEADPTIWSCPTFPRGMQVSEPTALCCVPLQAVSKPNTQYLNMIGLCIFRSQFPQDARSLMMCFFVDTQPTDFLLSKF